MPHRQLQQRGANDNEAELEERLDGFPELQQFENDVKNANESRDPDAESTEDDFDDDLARWQQHVLERPREGLRNLDIMFASSGYDYLTVLSLPNNSIDDITPIASSSKTLRLLNLNANVISRLPSPGDAFWPKFRCLSLLFLSGNNLATWRAMEGLTQCPKLLWLTVDGNPIMSQVNAREFLINKLPTSLKALNDHVITDVEYIKHAGRSIRFGAQNVRLFIGDALSVPIDFDENEAVALDYVARTETAIHSIYARNSPSMITQRVVRGHLSRQRHMPLYKRVRHLVVRVQSAIRGYFFRRSIRAEFAQLVTEQGQQDLLVGPMDDALFMTGGAHRGLRKLVTLVQQWRVRYRVKKQAIAVKKIRFWCQMVYQRYRYRSQQLLHDHQEIFIYYTAPFEGEILEMALKKFHRDPVLMTMSPSEREILLRQRCIHSGVSVLRSPSQSRVVTVSPSASSSPPSSPPPTAKRIQRDNLAIGALKKTLTPPLVRIFRKDQSLETNVLITEKQLIQLDLAMLKRMKKQTHQGSTKCASHRAMLVQIAQLTGELEQRLVIANRKILTACLKHQQQRTRPRTSFSLSRVAIRVRGHAPTRSERRKMNRLMPSSSFKASRTSNRIRRPYHDTKPVAESQPGNGHSHRPSDYTRMRVFIPWSIDMYMQMMASLDGALLLTNVSASFALSYEQTRQIHAATAIQSAWRAGRCHCKRDALEVTILRAVVCVQRWWRHAMGLGRRMAFLRACLLTCGAVNSPTLFMEAPVYQALSDTTAWTTQVRSTIRHCKEQALHCLMVDGAVEISLSPSQMMLFAASGPSSASAATQLWAGSDTAKVDAVSAQRCGAYLPVWLSPGAPEHFEESMVSRDADATPHLLVDRVHVEPTIIERELLLVGSTQGSNAADCVGSDNPYTRFAACRQVVGAGARVMELARKFSVEHRKAAPTATDSTASATSFVRLTFDSVEEARHRALVLLAKTFDPISHSYARLYSVEALVGATMLRHQWAVAQAIGDPASGEQFLTDCRGWLQAEVPSPWAVRLQQRMPQESLQAPSPDRHSRPVMAAAHHQVSGTVYNTARSSIVVPHRPAPPPLVAVSPMARHVDGPAPLHIAESFVEKGIQPVPPSRPSVSSPSPGTAFSRHQLLTDRLGKPAYETLDDMRHLQTKDRDMFVRDHREERERAVEALIVDKRMIQREHAAELAGIHLEMHVKLQKIKYEQELTKIQTRELVEREKMNEHTRKLTHQFEKSFVAQSGAMMRNAARRAVETKLVKKEATRKAVAAEIREREEEALERRQDAKSYWFVSNQKSKQRVDDTTEMALVQREKKEKKREQGVRQRIKDDKEIKKMLRLM